MFAVHVENHFGEAHVDDLKGVGRGHLARFRVDQRTGKGEVSDQGVVVLLFSWFDHQKQVVEEEEEVLSDLAIDSDLFDGPFANKLASGRHQANFGTAFDLVLQLEQHIVLFGNSLAFVDSRGNSLNERFSDLELGQIRVVIGRGFDKLSQEQRVFTNSLHGLD